MPKPQEIYPGVLLKSPDSGDLAEVVTYQDEIYKSFMDYFYIKVPTEKLSFGQVQAICEVRRINREWSEPGSANSIARQLFRSLVHEEKPFFLLEIGPGDSPLLTPEESVLKKYLIADIGEPVVEVTKSNGYESVLFLDSLPLQDQSVDLVIAIFVLHFRFEYSQIEEISRVLKIDGLFVANVYRRDKNSKAELRSKMEQSGMVVRAIDDPLKLCKDHEYWIIGKNPKRIEDLKFDGQYTK